MSVAEKAQKLRSLVRLLADASEVVIKEWEAEERVSAAASEARTLPSQELHRARRVIRGACGMCADLVQEPLNRLEEMAHGALSLVEAIYICVAARIPDILGKVAPDEGLSVAEISCQTGINEGKLSKAIISAFQPLQLIVG